VKYLINANVINVKMDLYFRMDLVLKNAKRDSLMIIKYVIFVILNA